MGKQRKIVYCGEYGPIAVDESGKLTFGDLVRYIRKQHSLEVGEVGILYGKIAGADSVTGRHIQRMEQNDTFFPDHPDRRWILAKILNIPPTLLALVGLNVVANDLSPENTALFPRRHIDVHEYHTALQSYWLRGYSVTTSA
ncbi:MAG: hypothetical protein ACRDHW_05600, partial [Ktedonobacteraceae bacterium]